MWGWGWEEALGVWHGGRWRDFSSEGLWEEHEGIRKAQKWRKNWPVGHSGLLEVAGEGGFSVRKVNWECSEYLRRLRKGFLLLLLGQSVPLPVPREETTTPALAATFSIAAAARVSLGWLLREGPALPQGREPRAGVLMLPGWGWGSGSSCCGRLSPKTVAGSGYNFPTLAQRLQEEGGRCGCTDACAAPTADPCFLWCTGAARQLSLPGFCSGWPEFSWET